MNDPDGYVKSSYIRGAVQGRFGQCVLASEGDEHRRDRKILNPCFTVAHIRGLTPIVYEKAFKLRDIWLNKIEESDCEESTIDVLSWLSRRCLDIIGVAGFNQELDSMDAGRGNELARVFEAGFGTDNFLAPLAYLQSKYRVFRLIPDAESRRISHSRETYHKYGAQLVQEKERAILEEESKLINGTVSGKSARARDLLSALNKRSAIDDNPLHCSDIRGYEQLEPTEELMLLSLSC